MKKFLAAILAAAMLATTFAGCGGGGSSSSAPAPSAEAPKADAAAPSEAAPEAPADNAAPTSDQVFAFVAKDVNNPYMQKAYEGFEKACGEIGVTPLYKGPDQATPEKQIEIINQLVAQKVAVIAIAANDADALQPALSAAMDQGIKVLSLDSAVNKDSRMVHIQQADPEKIGRGLIQAAAEMVNGDGGMAILSATAQATNQNLWIEWMKKEIEEGGDKYAKTPLVKIAYGDDDPTKSTSETTALLTDESIKVIIAPTTVGMLAAGKVLQDKQSTVKLTGLGLPSEMAPFIEDGVCPWMYLWNPIDIGYLAGYAGKALADGAITGAEGDKLTAGDLGEKVVTAAADEGTEIMLGDPFKFDPDNIAEWKDVY